MTRMDNIHTYYQNCRGLRTKSNEFYQNMLGCDYHMVCLTETWLNDTHNSYNYFNNDYFVFRKDRLRPDPDIDVRGEGVLIAVKKTLKVHRRFDLDYPNIQCVWVEIKINQNFSLLVGNHYIPCNINTHILDDYCNFIIDNINISSYKIICIGDFNCPRFDWSLGISTNINSYIRRKSDIVYSFLCNLNLSQQNDIRLIQGDNILDLVCSNFGDELSVRHEQEIIPQDNGHPSLLVTLCLPIYNTVYTPSVKKDFAKGDFLGLYNYLSSYEFVHSNDPDILVSDLNDAVTGGIATFVPNKIIQPSRFPHWFSVRLKYLLNSKEKFHKKSKKNPNNVYFKEQFIKFRKLCKKRLILDEKMYSHKIESDLANDPKFFWRYIKTKYKSSNEICIVQNGQVLAEDRVPECFAQHFSTIYSNNAANVNSSAQYGNSYNDDCTRNLNLSPLVVPPLVLVGDVIKAAKTLKNSRVAGSDGIPSFIAKGCIIPVAPILCKIFNACLATGKFPKQWKTSVVVPVPKTGNINEVKNYRPISLLCNFSKIFEKIIVQHLTFHVKGLISQHQHGFLGGRSTATNLVSFLQFVAPAVLSKGQIDTIYFDLSKAFDVVTHDLLLKKLDKYGLSPEYVAFLRHYLFDRYFFVKHGNFLSIEHPVPSGVIQGSNIGPLLFVLFFDDIKNVITGNFEMYADDLKVSHYVSDSDDADLLQNDINSIVNWCVTNGMECNTSKTVVMSFTRKQNTYFHSYVIDDTPITRKLEHRDLGIMMDVKLNFNYQIQKMTSAAKKKSALVYWVSKNFTRPSTATLLYSALVRSKLEYCSEVWNSITNTESAKVEQVQKTFFRRLTFRAFGRSSSYKDSLIMYKVSKLQTRRSIKDVCFLFKLISNLIDNSPLLEKVRFNLPRINTRHIRHFKVPPSQNTSLIPLNRMMITSNMYPNLDFFQSPSSFITNLTLTVNDAVQ